MHFFLGVLRVKTLLFMDRLLDEEEALEELDELDQDGDEKIQWKEFVESHFSYTEDEVKEMREKRSAEHEELLMVRLEVDLREFFFQF